MAVLVDNVHAQKTLEYNFATLSCKKRTESRSAFVEFTHIAKNMFHLADSFQSSILLKVYETLFAFLVCCL